MDQTDLAARYAKQKLIELKGEKIKSTVTVGDLNIPLLTTDRKIQQKINKNIELNTNSQQDRIDIYRTLHPITQGYTFFSSADGPYTKMDHIMDH